MSVVAKSDRMMHLLRRATRRFPAITVVLLTAVLVLVAFLHRGIEVTELDVDDGGICPRSEPDRAALPLRAL